MNPSNPNSVLNQRFIFSACALLATGFLVLIYANGFNGSWQYDDNTNIVENQKVHLESMSWGGLAQAFQAAPSCRSCIQRPLAYLSFALNYLWCGLEPWGYHCVNLIIHLISAVMLYAFICELLQTPRLKNRYGTNVRWIALIGSLLWATHPIQVTTVTYIIQRMASMAAMFAILALYLFLKARTTHGTFKSLVFFSLSLLAYLAGLATKENIILIPVCMLLLEVAVIGGLTSLSRKTKLAMLISGLITMGVLIYTIVFIGDINLIDPFSNRPYTSIQRMLTQPRVLWLYLAWIFFPMRSSLTLLHDIDVSMNLLQPGTTLPAMVCLLSAVLVLLFFIRRYPLTAFCFLFFFVNHLVEASFLNLGLIYEHRNYLPSMLVFVPPSAWLVQFVSRRDLNRFWRNGCLAALTLLILSNGHMVNNYNKAFATELTLWHDVVTKSPKLSVAHNNLGKVLWDLGAFEKANETFELAQDLNRYTDFSQIGMILHNLGLYQTYILKAYAPALNLFQEALQTMNGKPSTWYHVVRCHLLLGEMEQAEKAAKTALEYWPTTMELHVEMAMIHLLSGRFDDALSVFSVESARQWENAHTAVVIGEIYRAKGDLLSAEKSYLQYLDANPAKLTALVNLIQLGSNRDAGNEQYILMLLELSGAEKELRNEDTMDRKQSDLIGGSYDAVKVLRDAMRKAVPLSLP